jgi:hypothetical protein
VILPNFTVPSFIWSFIKKCYISYERTCSRVWNWVSNIDPFGMRLFINKYELRKLIFEVHEFHDGDITHIYIWKLSCDINKMNGTRINMSYNTNKCYISYKLTCFRVYNWITNIVFLIYKGKLHLFKHYNIPEVWWAE